MGKSSAATNVVDLEAFRRRKRTSGERGEEMASMARAMPVMVPVWFCWVPVWAPLM